MLLRVAVVVTSIVIAVAPSRDAARAELTKLGYTVDDDGLRRAVRWQDQRLIRLYLAAGISADLEDEGASLLVAAARRGHVETVRILLDAGADVHAGSEAALEAAVGAGRAEVVPLLVEHGADVSAPVAQGTLVLEAISRGEARVVKALGDGGADLDAASGDGTTPLLAAAAQGDPEMIRTLLHGGAGLNRRSSGRSALATAVWAGQRDAVQVLVEAGATMEDKERAELLAASREHSELRPLLELARPAARPSPQPKR